jgi:hypothetical protein
VAGETARGAADTSSHAYAINEPPIGDIRAEHSPPAFRTVALSPSIHTVRGGASAAASPLPAAGGGTAVLIIPLIEGFKNFVIRSHDLTIAFPWLYFATPGYGTSR